jgi:hypothetical protein
MLRNSSEVPQQLIHPDFTAKPLTSSNFELDYAAYMASTDVIQPHSDGRWPVDGFTLDEDRELVDTHEADHKAGRAFTFVLLDPDEREALGCLYLNPLAEYLDRVDAPSPVRERYGRAAMVTFWLKTSKALICRRSSPIPSTPGYATTGLSTAISSGCCQQNTPPSPVCRPPDSTRSKCPYRDRASPTCGSAARTQQTTQ